MCDKDTGQEAKSALAVGEEDGCAAPSVAKRVARSDAIARGSAVARGAAIALAKKVQPQTLQSFGCIVQEEYRCNL